MLPVATDTIRYYADYHKEAYCLIQKPYVSDKYRILSLMALKQERIMRNVKILWTDDEIDLLKPHIMFLKEKGYEVDTASNGDDAIEMVSNESYDLVFLDENMPGISGLETLSEIKAIRPGMPVVMITKNEEEDIMDAAIGSKIADFLIKPVNPKQILLTIKKFIDTKRLVTREVTSAYQSEFGKIGMDLMNARDYHDWANMYKKLVFWELELQSSNDKSMEEVLKMQKTEANQSFAKFVRNNYLDWLSGKSDDKPLLSPGVLKQKVLPYIDQGEKVFFIVIDNLRYDQWRIISREIKDLFTVDEEMLYYSILPTATQYARNAMFAGLMPYEIKQMYPDLWVDEEDDEGKNNYEEEMLTRQLARLGYSINTRYEKILNQRAGKKVVDNLSDLLQKDLVTLVYNFVDILSHARTDVEMIRELAPDEPAYRSLTLSWFKHSDLQTLLDQLSQEDVKVIVTTDHGTIRVQNPIKVIGDKKTSVNLRYKQGKNLNYNSKEVFELRDPEKAHLPLVNVSTSYIFAQSNDFMAYPNNFNYYVSYYKNTFQHGGVSMEEMIIPLSILSPR